MRTLILACLLIAAPVSAQTVYVIDSGVSGATLGPDFTGGNGTDCHGHGSAMAGISGIPVAQIVSVRVLDCAGFGSYGNFVNAASWVRDTAQAGDLVLFAINLFTQAPDSGLTDAIRASIANGTTWVVAAGNNNTWSFFHPPGDVDEAVMVGAADGLYKSSYSNFGPHVDLYAEGCANGWCGSSVSAATVAGQAYTLLQGMPWAPPAHLRNVLVDTCTTWSMIDPGPGTTSARFVC